MSAEPMPNGSFLIASSRPTPWVKFGKVALNGRQTLGLCRVEFDANVGLFHAQHITEDPVASTWFQRGALFRLDEMSEEQATREVQRVAEERAEEAERERVRALEQSERVIRVHALARDLVLTLKQEGDAELTWKGDVEPQFMRLTVTELLRAARTPNHNPFQLGLSGLRTTWIGSDAARELEQFVFSLGGRVNDQRRDVTGDGGDLGDDGIVF